MSSFPERFYADLSSNPVGDDFVSWAMRLDMNDIMMTITENELFRFKKMQDNDTKWKKCLSLSMKYMSAKFEKATKRSL